MKVVTPLRKELHRDACDDSGSIADIIPQGAGKPNTFVNCRYSYISGRHQ